MADGGLNFDIARLGECCIASPMAGRTNMVMSNWNQRLPICP